VNPPDRARIQGEHERPSDALSATAAMHDKFGHFYAVRLVRSPRRVELDCADDALIIARNKEHGTGMAFGHRIPPSFFGTGKGQGSQKTHGCPRINRID